MDIVSNIRVGRADISPSSSSHTPGVREGNAPHRRLPELRGKGLTATSTARRSTGINPEARNPIDPRSPNLSPA